MQMSHLFLDGGGRTTTPQSTLSPLPMPCPKPMNNLQTRFLSSSHQVRDAVFDPSAITPTETLTFPLFTSVNSPLLPASPDRNHGLCPFANFQRCSDLEPSGSLPEVLIGTSPHCSLPKHPETYRPCPAFRGLQGSHGLISHRFVQFGFRSNSTLPFSCSEPLTGC